MDTYPEARAYVVFAVGYSTRWVVNAFNPHHAKWRVRDGADPPEGVQLQALLLNEQIIEV